jgi:hypothetical protein
VVSKQTKATDELGGSLSTTGGLFLLLEKGAKRRRTSSFGWSKGRSLSKIVLVGGASDMQMRARSYGELASQMVEATVEPLIQKGKRNFDSSEEIFESERIITL